MMAISTILISFKQKVEEAVSMVPDMIAEEKLRAVQFWNVVSEKLQEIVNNSAADITALAFELDKDKLPEYLDGALSSISAPPGVVSGLGGCGGMGNPIISGAGGTYVSPNLMKKYICRGESRNMEVSAPVLGIQRPRHRNFGCIGSTGSVSISSSHANTMLFPLHPKCNPLSLSNESPLPVSVGLRVRCISDEDNIEENEQLEGDMRECNEDGSREDENDNSNTLGFMRVEDVAITDQEEEIKEASSPEGSMVHLMISADPIDSATNDSTSSLMTSSETSVDGNPDKGERARNPGEDADSFNSKDRRRNELKPYNCFDCKSSFSSKGNLIVHTRRHTGEKPYACAQCESRFSTKGNLKRHIKAHSGVKPWECTTCGGRFTEKKSLKVHMRRHTGERPYQCNLCLKKFSQSGILQSHMAMHLNQKAHLCELCGKSFRQKSQLRLHTQRHQGVRKFDCPHCPAKFLTKGDMLRHKRTHTGERPFECSLCGKTFTRQQSLNEHTNRHYGRKPYKCKYCRKGFAEMSACYKHIKSHEKVREPGHNIKEDASENDQDEPPPDSLSKIKLSDKLPEEIYQEKQNQENCASLKKA